MFEVAVAADVAESISSQRWLLIADLEFCDLDDVFSRHRGISRLNDWKTAFFPFVADGVDVHGRCRRHLMTSTTPSPSLARGAQVNRHGFDALVA